jgi:hypothetical protein
MSLSLWARHLLIAAKRATTTIPIVMANAGDPLAFGIVASLAHPGGNITGRTLYASELAGKRLEVFKEAVIGRESTPLREVFSYLRVHYMTQRSSAVPADDQSAVRPGGVSANPPPSSGYRTHRGGGRTA